MTDPPCLSFAGGHRCPSSHRARGLPRRRGRPVGGRPGAGEFSGVPYAGIFEGGGTQLSSARQELRRSAVHAQQVVEAREERDVAILTAQTAEAEVERLTKLVADLHCQHLSAGPSFSWNVAGVILTDFVLNFQDQVPNLPSLLEVYK
ncbi:hypothetical protein LIER_11313 [Lithospermum erythrorhizon]|uniref:Uncharacterized protein n=1 Tax=Lithospermum erythrorhizon TaxID=34254 RepID=A0AAV3PQG5_LITER